MKSIKETKESIRSRLCALPVPDGTRIRTAERGNSTNMHFLARRPTVEAMVSW